MVSLALSALAPIQDEVDWIGFRLHHLPWFNDTAK
jgi:hypothetical protein